jgi:cell division protease FtsH
VTVVMPPPPPPQEPAAQGEIHQPQQAPVADPRFPWKARGTRKPMSMWDRVKFLMMFAAIFIVLVWYDLQRFSPPATFGEIAGAVAWDQQWILWLAGLEAVRQLHCFVGEHSRGYNRFWTERVFGRSTRAYERRFNNWTRFRISRVLKWVFLLILVAIVLGKVTNSSPVVALFKVPALAVQAMPMALQIIFSLFFVVAQFGALFWFMSRGGVDTYFPDDIETRFSDVWGQDHVVERVKENMVLLEDPESIEAKGGHVPSGILLWGPPGTGKTLMAEAVAGETGKPYVFVDPGAFQNMFMGVGILKVKGLFRRLRKLAIRYGGVIVFFDEADSLGSRGGTVGGAAPGYNTPAPWSSSGCNGFTHLTPHTRWTLAQHALASQPDDEPAPRRGLRERVVGMPMNGMGGGGDMGTLQALLTELSGLKKPRGFINRTVRKTLGMRPKPPPKYRILVMMATNLPDALDPALLRPGRIDRTYRVGYPSKAGRIRTYQGYFGRVRHELTDEQIDKLATITPYATGAKIKDLVNEALIYSIRESREVVTWKDVIKAKHLKDLGPAEDVEYIERERHAVAVHEACHAVLAWSTRRHMEIDLATIEMGSTYLGMVASIPPEEQFTRWRTEYESDILVSLASLAGERMFFGEDNSSGVSGDLQSATTIAGLMESHWGMGSGLSSLPALQNLGINGGGNPEDRRKGGEGGIGFGAQLAPKRPEIAAGPLPQRIEANLVRLLDEAEKVLQDKRGRVLSLAHALETHKTLTGEDVIAVLEGKQGPLVDGRPYSDPDFIAELERYHEFAGEAHREHAPVSAQLPVIPGTILGEVTAERPVPSTPWVAASSPQPDPQQPYPGQPYPYQGEPYPYPGEQNAGQPYEYPPSYPAPAPAGGQAWPGQQPYPGQQPEPAEASEASDEQGDPTSERANEQPTRPPQAPPPPPE